MGVAPIAPHTETKFLGPTSVVFDPPVPAKRHEGLFLDAKVPRVPNFNPDQVSNVCQRHKLMYVLMTLYQ
jgi:hypothetical protein